MLALLMNKYVLGSLAVVLVIGGATWAHSRYVDGKIEEAINGLKYGDNKHVDKLVDDAVAANDAKWQAAIDKQKAEAKAKLDEVIAANAEEKRKNIEDNRKLEAKNAAQKSELAIARAAAKSAKLRDPGKGSGVGGSCPQSGEKGDSAKPAGQEGGGELSPELTEFLIGEASRADEVTLVANTCLAFIHKEIP